MMLETHYQDISESRNPMVFIFFRRSIWNELFYIIRFKEIKKEVCPKWCWVNSHWYTNILFKNHATSRVKKHLFIDKSLCSGVSSSSSLRSLIDICLEKPMCLLTLDLKAKLITLMMIKGTEGSEGGRSKVTYV